MLKGFNYPLTPKGKSTLNPPPPWYYSSDYLNIEFWAEASAVAALLPPGLEPDRSANGHANALFGEELSDLAPVRSGKGIRASMAYIVDDLKTLKDLRR